MKRVNVYEEVNAAVMRHFGRGFVTNCFLGGEIYEREIAAGRLYLDEWESSCLLYRKRDGYSILNFYHREDAPFPPVLPETVTEIAYRERDISLVETAKKLEENGMKLLFSRIRMKYSGEEETYSHPYIRSANDKDTDAVSALLSSSFDRRTGCLPTADELKNDIADGKVLLWDDDSIGGLLHFSCEKAVSEIRHLAVAEDRRGEGIASLLVKSYLSAVPGRKRVWLREDYQDARRVYEKNGFEPDGMKSAVLYQE